MLLRLAAVITVAGLALTLLPPEAARTATQCAGSLEVATTHDVAGYVVSAQSADLTGDGAKEIVLAGREGVRVVQPFEPTEQATVWSAPVGAELRRVAVAELDDAVGSRVIAAGHRLVVALQGDTGAEHWRLQFSQSIPELRTGDIVGDGSDELVLVSGSQLEVRSAEDGTHLFPTVTVGWQVTDLRLDDLTGDGQLEAVVTSRDGWVRAIDLVAGTELWVHQVARPDSDGLRAVAVGDVTGDGRNEVLAAGRGERTSLTAGRGETTTSTATRGYLLVALDGSTGELIWDYGQNAGGSASFRAVALGDVTGDGRLDVVGQAARLRAGHLVALDGRGERDSAGRATGEPRMLWAHDTARGDGDSHSPYNPDALMLTDGDGDGHADAYTGMWNGHLIAVAGAPPGGGSLLAPPRADTLWEAPRTPPYTAVSLFDGAEPLVLSASGDHLVSLRDPATGEIVWGYDAGGPTQVAAGAFTGHLRQRGSTEVGVVSKAGRVHGLDRTGEVMEPATDVLLPHSGEAVAAVDVTGDGTHELVAGSAGGAVWAVDPTTSTVLWEVGLGEPVQALTTDGHQVVVGLLDGTAVALAASDGASRWQHDAGAAINTVTYSAASDRFAVGTAGGDLHLLQPDGTVSAVSSAGASVNDLAPAQFGVTGAGFAAAVGNTSQGSLQAFSATGDRLWVEDVGVGVVEVAAGDLTGDGHDDVVGTAVDFHAYAIDGADGQRLWRLQNGLPGPVGVADVSGGGQNQAVLTSPGPSQVRLVDQTGTVSAACSLPKFPYSLAVGDVATGKPAQQIIIGTHQGHVYTLR